jgi:signal transduction histidine kinase
VTLVAILTVLPFAAAFAAIAVAVDHAATIEERVRRAQDERANVLRLQLDQETSVRGYAVTRNAIFLDPYSKARQPFDASLSALKAAVLQVAPEIATLVDNERITHQEWIDSVAVPLIANPGSQSSNALELRGKHLVDQFRNDNDAIGRALGDAARRSDSFARTLVYAIIVAGLVLGTGLLVFMFRIGERERALAQELRKTNAELRDAARAKDHFLARMSHELRTPLNGIIGFTGTLLMKLPGPLTGEQERQLGIIDTSARHLLSLINDLLDLSRVQAGKVEAHFETVDVRKIVEDVAAALRGLAEQKGLEFEVRLDDGTALTDMRMLHQILTNLISNAIKYTEEGYIRIELRREQRSGTGWLDVRIADSGIGIDAEDQMRIFEAFERIDSMTTRRVVGTGLGLFLSHRFATMIGGSLAVRSKRGAGSVFTLSLPLDD